MTWYKNGRVSINTGDTYLTGINTRFASNTRVGDAIRAPDGEWYELVNTSSETVIGIYPAYRGPSVVDSTDYMIAPIQGYNKETADRLRYITDNIRDFSEDVTAARESAQEAKLSENAAKISENNSKASELAAKISENKAKASEIAASVSEVNASTSADRSDTAADDALASQNAAKDSEIAALASKNAAKTSENAAKVSETNSKASETNSKASENASKTSETNAHTSELNAANSATTASTGANTATSAKNAAQAAQVLSEKARDDAIAAASTVTGNLSDNGPVDLSSGVYPTKPVVSGFWKVVVGGTVTDNGETIEYGAGDTLVWSKPMEQFYKIDNTESVSSVNGQKGVVVLTKTDVGLSLVDNTSDVNKPISTAAQTAINLKINKADIVDNLTSTDATKVLSAKQGKAIYDLIQANNTTLVVYEYVATLGQTVFTGADIHGKTMSLSGAGTVVSQNGVQLQITVDYTTTGTNTVTLVKPVEQAGDLIQVQAFGAFSVANHYTKAEEDGLLDSKADKITTYTKVESDSLITSAKPHVGKIDWESSRAMLPVGALPMDGLLYSRATYPDLWNLINTAKLPVIAEATWQADPTKRGCFTVGTDGTNFRVPDYNGKFTGSLGAVFRRGDGILSAAVAGVIQPDAFQDHYVRFYSANISGAAGTNFNSLTVGPSGNLEAATLAGFRLGDSSFEVKGAAGTPRTASETRSLNITGVWYVRAFGSVNNAGTLDASTLAANQAAQSARIGSLELANTKVYTCWQLGSTANPTTGRVLFTNQVVSIGGIVINDSTNRQFVIPVSGTYRIDFTALTSPAPARVNLMYQRGAGTDTRIAQTYANASSLMAIHEFFSFIAGDKVSINIISGTLSNSVPDPFGTLLIERIDN
jgi:hypothetical protein